MSGLQPVQGEAVKIILREHVDHLGERGEIVTVTPGYARNFLLPKGLAYLATPGNIKQIEHQRRVWAARDMKDQQDAEALAARMAALDLTVTHKAGESGTLYGAVTPVEIAALLVSKGIKIDRRKLEVSEPIKSTGEYEFRVRLHPKVIGTVKLHVVAEGKTE